MEVHRCKYLQDNKRPFSNCKSNEELPHIALPCYNESEKNFFLHEMGQVDVLVKCLRIVLVYRIFYKTKP